ncbi:MAG: enoyl-CoA hydratase-related protein, partial [Desulfobacterales bacterium]
YMIRTCGKPVIARINGLVAGGGNEINLACDLSIAADHARFIQPGTRTGSVSAGGATQWLPLAIGDKRSRWMVMVGDEIDAPTALKWGLVNEVACPAFFVDGDSVRIDTDRCTGCAFCAQICPENAILPVGKTEVAQ